MINTIITKASKRGKFLDFRDNLVPANDKDYAMVHGVGGKDFAASSTIKLMICDYSKGTGNNSVSVSVNVSPDVIYRLKDAARDRLTTGVSVVRGKAISENGEKMLASAIRGMVKLRDNAMNAANNTNISEVNSIGNLLMSIQKEISPVKKAGDYDFMYEQDKVDPYKIDANGMTSICKLTISRQEIRPDGNKSENPWYIAIMNGRAKVNKQANGTISYSPNTVTDKVQAFINLSDAEMFKATQRVVRFIELWENSLCIPKIINGREQREQDRIAAMNARG